MSHRVWPRQMRSSDRSRLCVRARAEQNIICVIVQMRKCLRKSQKAKPNVDLLPSIAFPINNSWPVRPSLSLSLSLVRLSSFTCTLRVHGNNSVVAFEFEAEAIVMNFVLRLRHSNRIRTLTKIHKQLRSHSADSFCAPLSYATLAEKRGKKRNENEIERNETKIDLCDNVAVAAVAESKSNTKIH